VNCGAPLVKTQAQTAAAVGLSRQYLSEAEAGANITVDVVYRFAAHFDVPASAILD
jgi:transcriptional regulator with XRE-family HTH domain